MKGKSIVAKKSCQWHDNLVFNRCPNENIWLRLLIYKSQKFQIKILFFTAGEKNMYDAEFTTLLFRFLQLTGEGHNNGEFSKSLF